MDAAAVRGIAIGARARIAAENEARRKADRLRASPFGAALADRIVTHCVKAAEHVGAASWTSRKLVVIDGDAPAELAVELDDDAIVPVAWRPVLDAALDVLISRKFQTRLVDCTGVGERWRKLYIVVSCEGDA